MIAFIAAVLAAFAQAPADSAPSCSRESATRATVVEIARSPEKFLDRCVTVTGAFAGIQMYSGRDGMYLAHRFGRDGNRAPANLVHRIGIDSQDMRELRMRYPQLTTVTGRVDSCERRFERIKAAGGVPFLGGYCHYERGPTIVVHSYSITERRFERMMGESARRQFGSLAPAPANWPARAQAEAVASDFLGALRSGDRAKLMALHKFRDQSNEYHRSVLFQLLEDRESVFAQLRQTASPQTAMFLMAGEDGAPLPARDTDAAATLCFCRTSDCTDRWPITANDANNESNRPYACTRVSAGGDRGLALDTPIGGGWVVEPARTAFQR